MCSWSYLVLIQPYSYLHWATFVYVQILISAAGLIFINILSMQYWFTILMLFRPGSDLYWSISVFVMFSILLWLILAYPDSRLTYARLSSNTGFIMISFHACKLMLAILSWSRSIYFNPHWYILMPIWFVLIHIDACLVCYHCIFPCSRGFIMSIRFLDWDVSFEFD